MDYYFSQAKAPFYNIYNSKLQKQIEMNKSNSNNYNNLINHKNLKSFRKEMLSGDKNPTKKYKTSKNSPEKDNTDMLLFKDFSKENKNIKMNSNNNILRNENKIENNELNNDIFINKMKRMTYKKVMQAPSVNRPNSNSLLGNSGNMTDYLYKKIVNNSNDKRYELSMNNNSGSMKNIPNNNIYANSNNNFYYNNNLFNYCGNSFEDKEMKNINNMYNNLNVNKSGLNQFNNNQLNSSNSMKIILSKKHNNNLLNKYYYNINNINNNSNNHNFNENIDIENLLDNDNEIKDSYNKRRIIANCNLVKNRESKLTKKYVQKNNNFKINHNNNFNSNEKMNKIYEHHRINNNDMQNNNKIKKISAMNYLNNNMKSKKEYPKYMLKYDNKHENNNNSGINLINKKKNNILDYEMSGIDSELSKINKTTRLNSKCNNTTNKLDNAIYQEINNDLSNIDDNIYVNPNMPINNLIKSIEGYINNNQNSDRIKNNKENPPNNNSLNKKIYKANLYNILKLKGKEKTNSNIHHNNSENKLKLKKDTNTYISKPIKQQMKGNSDTGNNAMRSSSCIPQKAAKLSHSNNINSKSIKNLRGIKNIKKIIRNSNNLNLNDNHMNHISNNISNNNLSNINSISISQSNNFNTINDKKNSTANNFMIKEFKIKEKLKNSANNTLSNNVSINKVSINSINNNETGGNCNPKDLIYQKKISNNKVKTKIENYVSNQCSSIKVENRKPRIIKTKAPVTNYQSPKENDRKKFITNIEENNVNNENNNTNNIISNENDTNNTKKINNTEIKGKKEEVILSNINEKKLENNNLTDINNINNKDLNYVSNVENNDNKNKTELDNNLNINDNIIINNIEVNNKNISKNSKNDSNISEFPVNESVIKSKIEEHNNVYINKNNIMALNEKNNEKNNINEKSNVNEKEQKADNIDNNINNNEISSKLKEEEDEKKIEVSQSKENTNKKESKEIFKSVHDSDTLIDKEKHLVPQLCPKLPFSKINEDEKLSEDKKIDITEKVIEDDIKEKDLIFVNKKENNLNNEKENTNPKEKEEEIKLKDEKEKEKTEIKTEKENLEIKEKEIKEKNEEKEDIKEDVKDVKKDENISNIDIEKVEKDQEKKEVKKVNEENNDINENIDLNYIKNHIIMDKNDLNNLKEEQKDNNDSSPENNEDNDTSQKNKRTIYKINEKKSSKEKQYDLIKNMYKQDMLCEPINAKNPKQSMTNSKNYNIMTTTVTKDCDFYQNEQEKLGKFIKNFYQTNQKYPKSNINFYLYGRQIGHGAFGQVNIALHIGSGRLVAIKIFAKKNLKNTRAKQKIKNEIEMLSQFHHPFINQILDNFETDTHIFIVMEYVCGDLLGFIRKRGKLSESVSKLIFKQLIEGLKYIHKKNVVHRDIKLDNILIDLTNTIKICDFGVSRKFSGEELMYEHCGTPAYISPEIFENNGYKGTGCDIWSAGVTLYYMLGGVQPFKANSIGELEKNIMKGDFKPLEEVSQEANDLIKGMLQVNPRKRFGVEEILSHPWLDKVDLNQRQKLNLFTEAEKILMSKFDVNYLSSDKSELIENFTMKNLEEENKKENKNGNTKSLIFAPYNSYIENSEENKDENNENNENNGEKKVTNSINVKTSFEEDAIYKELEVLNDVCKFGWKAQQANLQYELSNNGDFDNGLIKTQKEEDFKKKNEKIEKMYVNNNKSDKKSGVNTSRESLDFRDEVEGSIPINKKLLEKIEKELGYNKQYVTECIKKNKVNYATGTYYLLYRESQYMNDSNYNNKI